MLTIAGGIILAILLIGIFSAFYEQIIKASFVVVLIGIGILILGGILIVYLEAYENQSQPLLLIPILIVAYVFFSEFIDKDKKKQAEETSKKYQELQIKKENSNKVSKLFEQLKTDSKIEKIISICFYLLLDEQDDKAGNRSKEIEFTNFCFKIQYLFFQNKYVISIKKNKNLLQQDISNEFRLSECVDEWVKYDFTYLNYGNNLSIDDAFNFDKEVDNLLREATKYSYASVHKKNFTITSKGFFEDYKMIKNYGSRISILQHLIDEDGITVESPIRCNVKIDAEAEIDLSERDVKIFIDEKDAAIIQLKKWNQLRHSNIIVFKNDER